MHELGVLHQIAKTVNRIAKENHIRRIKHIALEVGELSGFVPQYLRKLYPVAADAFPILRRAELGSRDYDLVILENVGNLVCPAEFDTGAVKNMTILSVPEGHDKPLKYPLMYETCQLLVINKADVMPYFDFDAQKVVKYAKMRNPGIEILFVSAKTGEGVDAVADWIEKNAMAWNHG